MSERGFKIETVWRAPQFEYVNVGIEVNSKEHYYLLDSILRAHHVEHNNVSDCIVKVRATRETLSKIQTIYNAAKDTISDCPFCGGTATLKYDNHCAGHGDYYSTAHVACCLCGARTKGFVYDGCYCEKTTELDAINAWNNRVKGETE